MRDNRHHRYAHRVHHVRHGRDARPAYGPTQDATARRLQSIAIKVNTPFWQSCEVFVDAAITVAAIDRLVHRSTILEMNVESYRRRAAQAAQVPAKPARAGATTTATTEAQSRPPWTH